MYTQKAQGNFSFYGLPNTPHCGPKTSVFPVRIQCEYCVTLDYDDCALDSNGFLLDNTYFAVYFGDFAYCRIGFSCERLAKLIAEQLKRISGARHCECTVRPLKNVEVSYVA